MKQFNFVTGAIQKFYDTRISHARRSVLPPQKRYNFDGKGKPEYM
jgi:hypothetical protein